MTTPGQCTTLEERVWILEQAQAGQSDPAMAEVLGRPVATVRKWRRIAQAKGRAGLSPRRGRPPTGALGQTPQWREIVRSRRQKHEGWGPQTILCDLRRLPSSPQVLPSRARIAAFLHQEGLVRQYQRHIPLPHPPTAAPTAPHDCWQMDTQGAMQVTALGRVALINVVDRFSRVKPISWPCVGTTKPVALDYQVALRYAFLNYGLPQRISLDHDTAFYDSTCPSPYPTGLHLWLLALGIPVTFIRQHCPTDHACIERTHQTVTAQAITGQQPGTVQQLRQTLNERLSFLNSDYPSRCLGGKAPLVAYPDACFSGRPYRPEWEEMLLELDRVYAYLAGGRWFRQVGTQGQFWLGDLRYGLGKTWAKQKIEIRFDPETQELICVSADGSRTARRAGQGLSKAALMGDLPPLLSLSGYQPTLPFDAPGARQAVLCQLLNGTHL